MGECVPLPRWRMGATFQAAPEWSLILSRTGEYAIRAMSQLALLEPEERLPGGELAELTQIPLPYLSKVMRRMVVAGLVDSRRGHHGGFALSWTPEEISVHEILSAVGESFDATHCVFGWQRCNASSPCLAHDMWRVAKDGLMEWASSHSLADVRKSALRNAGRARPGS